VEKCSICERKQKNNVVICEGCYTHFFLHRHIRGRPRKYSKYSLQEIADTLQISRSSVWKFFKQKPIDGHKKKIIKDFLSKEGELI